MEYRLIFHGREDCDFCKPYAETLQNNFPTEVDEYSYDEYDEGVVPRLTALNMGGKVIGERKGVLRRHQFINFLKELNTYEDE